MKTADITDAQVCSAYQMASTSERTAEIVLREMTGAPTKVCLSAMVRANDRGLIEFGVSLRTGWLTDAGRATLNS